jgi:transcriptional regulator with PAS, ATPase and Fis domain
MDAIRSLVNRIDDGIKKFVVADHGEELKERIEQSKKTYVELESRLADHAEGFKSFHERATMLEYIADHIPVSVCVFDMNSKYIYVNDMYARLNNKKMEDIIGCSVEEICGEVIWDRVKENHKKVIGGESITENYKMVGGALGNNFDVQYFPYYNGGVEQVGYLMIARIVESENGDG